MTDNIFKHPIDCKCGRCHKPRTIRVQCEMCRAEHDMPIESTELIHTVTTAGFICKTCYNTMTNGRENDK